MSKHDHDHGLAHDLAVMQRRTERRTFLRWMAGFAGAALVPMLGCGEEDGSSASSSSTDADAGSSSAATDDSATGTTSSTSTCASIPEETAGPYPGDGSNGVNALTESGIVRSDIKTSFGSYSGTAAGVPLTITLKLVDVTSSCAPLDGYAIYVWHCDRDGNYSLYTAKTENYLRGVQSTGSDGTVTFESIFPACYSGRWPHIHFEVYPSAAKAIASGNKIATSQMAMPADVCKTVFAEAGYEDSIANLAKVTLGTDNVFSDGTTLESPTITGSVAEGYALTFTIGVRI